MRRPNRFNLSDNEAALMSKFSLGRSQNASVDNLLAGRQQRDDSLKQRERIVGGYTLQTRLGSGAFGEIYKCRSTIDNATYGIKEIQIGIDGGGNIQSITEARLMQRVKHKNIV